MSGGRYQEIDLDLLADFVGGALDGTPEAVRIARLVAEDTAWADAHVASRQADGLVRARLADLGAAPDPIPAEIVDRIATSIAGLAGTTLADSDVEADPAQDAGLDPTSSDETADTGTDTDTGTAADTGTDTDTGTGTRAGTRPDGSDRVGRRESAPPRPGVPAGPTRPLGAGHSRRPGATPRRRWRRLAGSVAVVTAVAGFAGFALSRWVVPDSGGNSASVSSDSGAAVTAPEIASGAPRAVLEPSAERVLASGTNYTELTLPQAVRAVGGAVATTTRSSPGAGSATPYSASPAPSQVTGKATTSPEPETTAVPNSRSALNRLTGPEDLARCLDAVAVAHGRGPVAVDLVDYASFQGGPALVVAFTDGSGKRWAWVAGPDCGRPGFGADTRYSAPVG